MTPHLNRLRCGLVVRWCWVNFQCRGVLLIGIIVGQCADGGCLDIFTLVCHFPLLSLSGRRSFIDWNTVSKAIKHETTNQPMNVSSEPSQIETVQMRRHNICFCAKLSLIIFKYPLLSRALNSLIRAYTVCHYVCILDAWLHCLTRARGYKTFSCTTQLSMKF